MALNAGNSSIASEAVPNKSFSESVVGADLSVGFRFNFLMIQRIKTHILNACKDEDKIN